MSLTESGHLMALRGRGGGTFVSEEPPLAESSRVQLSAGHWREVLDYRIAVEVGAAVLAAERSDDLSPLRLHIETMRAATDFSTYRRADVVFHLGVAEAARSARLVAAMTEVQGKMSELIAHIAHPAPVLARSNEQHIALVDALERRDGWIAAQIVREHLKGTEQVLAGLMP
jgi:GntR family transcriptional repressor for pyruvate dehydrogenase complex